MRFQLLILIRFVVACVVSGSVFTANAQTCDRTVLKYVNGVLNFSPGDAAASALQISERLASAGINEPVRFIWNPSEGLGDLLEVFIAADRLPNWLQLTGKGFVRNYYDSLSPDFIARIYNSYIIGSPLAQASTASAVDLIKSSVISEVTRAKRPVILIAHSQGNMYVNKALQELRTDPAVVGVPGLRAVGVVGLGVAALDSSKPSPHYAYTTFKQDLIINALRILANVPPPNYDINEAYLGLINHVVNDYLSPDINLLVAGPLGSTLEQGITPAQRFVDNIAAVRRGVEAEWPCLSDPIVPASVKQFDNLELAVRVKGRPGDHRIPTGNVFFTLGGGNFCFGPIDGDGIAKCPPTRVPGTLPPREYSVRAVPILDVLGPFRWISDPENDRIGVVRVVSVPTSPRLITSPTDAALAGSTNVDFEIGITAASTIATGGITFRGPLSVAPYSYAGWPNAGSALHTRDQAVNGVSYTANFAGTFSATFEGSCASAFAMEWLSNENDFQVRMFDENDNQIGALTFPRSPFPFVAYYGVELPKIKRVTFTTSGPEWLLVDNLKYVPGSCQ